MPMLSWLNDDDTLKKPGRIPYRLFEADTGFFSTLQAPHPR